MKVSGPQAYGLLPSFGPSIFHSVHLMDIGENQMALRVELDKAVVVKALENAISLLRRNNANEVNPLMKDLREKDILKLQTAIAQISEIK